MTSHRSTFTSYWLWGDRRIRVKYNSPLYLLCEAAFLKIEVLHPRGALLPGTSAGRISLVLKGWDKRAADRDYVGYAQQVLRLPVPPARAAKLTDHRQQALF